MNFRTFSYPGSQVLRFHSFCNASALGIFTEWSSGCVGGGSNQMKVERMLINFQTTAYMTSYPGFLAISWLPNTLQTPVCPTAKTSARVTSLKTVTDALVLISMTSSRHVDWWRGKTCSGWTNIIDLHPCTVFLLDDARFKVYIKSSYDHDDIVTVHAQQNYTFLTDSPNLLYLLGIHHKWVYCEYKMLALICCQRDCDKL